MVHTGPSFARETMHTRAGFGRFSWFLLDKSYLSSRVKYKIRVDCKENAACYTYDELDSYEKNTFARNYIFCALFGMGLYLVLYTFMMMPELELNLGLLISNNSSSSSDIWTSSAIIERSNEIGGASGNISDSTKGGRTSHYVFDDPHIVIPVVVVTIFLVAALRSIVVLTLNSYLVLVTQTIVLTLAVLGTIEYNCQLNQENAYTGGGQFPIALLQAVVDWTHRHDDRFRHIFYHRRCHDSYKRMSAINLLSEIINFGFAIRVLTL